jgi:deoxyribonuclease-4
LENHVTIRFGTVGAPKGTPKSGTPAAIAYTSELGMGAFEIAWVQSVRVSDETCANINQAAAEHDVRLSVHAPYYINLNSQDAELMRKSDERLLAASRKGFLAGATDIIFHPGSYHSQPPEQVYERAKQKLVEIHGILAEEGVEVKLRPETMGKSAMFGSLEEVVQLTKELDFVAPCVDVAHLHARAGDGSFNTYDEFAAMFKYVQKELGKRKGLYNLHFHISGIDYGPKGEKKHLVLEEADLNWEAFLQAVIDFGVRGVMVAESPNLEEDALTVQRKYQSLAAKSA